MQILISYMIISIILFTAFNATTPLTTGSVVPTASQSSHSSVAFANISGTFTIPEAGFSITLPAGWSGIDLNSTALVSPTGINPTTGVLNPSSDFEKVFFILTKTNTSKANESPKERAIVNHRNYLKDSAQQLGCEVMSHKFVKLNGVTSEKLVGTCGLLQDIKVEAYAIASDKNVIFVGLKGFESAFNYNYQVFIQSVNTMKIENQTNIKSLISNLSIQ